jgi:hypothetical protein
MPTGPDARPAGVFAAFPRACEVVTANEPAAVVPAIPADLAYVVALQKRNGDAVGFIPRAALAEKIERNQVLLARENGDPPGTCTTVPWPSPRCGSSKPPSNMTPEDATTAWRWSSGCCNARPTPARAACRCAASTFSTPTTSGPPRASTWSARSRARGGR